eukprot:761802-Hanusia_phi.AAC.2
MYIAHIEKGMGKQSVYAFQEPRQQKKQITTFGTGKTHKEETALQVGLAQDEGVQLSYMCVYERSEHKKSQENNKLNKIGAGKENENQQREQRQKREMDVGGERLERMTGHSFILPSSLLPPAHPPPSANRLPLPALRVHEHNQPGLPKTIVNLEVPLLFTYI